MKIGCVRADTRFHYGRTRTFEQLLDVDISSLRANPGSNFPVAEMFSFTQTSVSQRKTYPVVPDPQIFGRFRHAIWCKIFRLLVVAPIATEHERRAHDCAAAPVKPFVLLLRCGKTRLIHQRDLPLKFNLVMITSFQFRPRRLCPKTPRRDDVEIVSDRNSHNLKSRLYAPLCTSNVKVQIFLCARSESHFSLPRGDFTAS